MVSGVAFWVGELGKDGNDGKTDESIRLLRASSSDAGLTMTGDWVEDYISSYSDA